jgi:hypothetical protein
MVMGKSCLLFSGKWFGSGLNSVVVTAGVGSAVVAAATAPLALSYSFFKGC